MEITHFLEILWQLTLAMAPYILFGLIFAGLLHQIVPQNIVTKHLGKQNISSIVKATIFGIPLPVCSCGVIPLATSIKKSGASKGATLSFLISTPITGVDSIMATYGMFGWIFTIYRIISSIFIALFAGILTNMFDKERKDTTQTRSKPIPSFSVTSPTNTTHFKMYSPQKPSSSHAPTQKNTKFSFKGAMEYAFITLLGDIAKPLFWGLLIGAVITIAIPDNLAQLLLEYPWLSYLIVIVIAIPMYVCATASLPIAGGLILSGVSVGAAFVFLSAGPATNTVTIGVVKKMLGLRALSIYLATLIVGSLLFGLGLDYIFDSNAIDPKSLVNIEESHGVVATFSAFLLWGLLLYFFIKPYFKPKASSCCTNENCNT